MDASIRSSLSAWAGGDRRPLVRLLGFEPTRRRADRTCVTIGRAGSTVAVLVTADRPTAVERARRIVRRDPARQHLFFVTADDNARLELIAFDSDQRVRCLYIEDVRAPLAADLDTLCDLTPQNGESGLALALRQLQALDRTRAGRKFFAAFRDMRSRVSAGWTGLPASRRRDRDRLALLFLCRLMFLYFLQRAGHLAGRTDYFAWLRRRHARGKAGTTFYRRMLVPLFHGALNRRPERRSARAKRLGRLPYLNGGLFERDACERHYPRLNLSDDVVTSVFGELLERYRFTSTESAPDHTDAGSVDPEMLGRVFEGLMENTERASTGTFYTPSALVTEVVRHGVAALVSAPLAITHQQATYWVDHPGEAPDEFSQELTGLRVLDPACGSGAFLLGTLAEISRLRRERGMAADGESLIAESLYGVDTQDDAALLCALRLWLTLLSSDDAQVAPLPNLDRRIRQGDALLDPLDLYSARHADRGALIADAGFRGQVAALDRAARAYVNAEPETKAALARALVSAENALAHAWVDVQLKRLCRLSTELTAARDAVDLFGQPTTVRTMSRHLAAVEQQQAELRRLRVQMRRQRRTPFFSFMVHFAGVMQRGFDLVVSNPPWVRSHRWPTSTATLVRERYQTCQRTGWPYASRLVGSGTGAAGQVDLAMLFLELSIRVLRPGGVIAMLLPAKLLRSLFAAGARRLLLDQTEIIRIEDRSLELRSDFSADAFVAILVARKKSCAMPGVPAPVNVILRGRNGHERACSIAPADLGLRIGDDAAPWLLAPPGVSAALRRMQDAGPVLGSVSGIRIRRGVMTGSNEVMVLRDVEPKLGGLSRVRARGSRSESDELCCVLESDCLRPLIRGADVRAWQCRPSEHLLWLYDEHLRLRTAPRHVARYLAQHARHPGNTGSHGGRLHRVSGALLETLVLWRDIARTVEAAPLLREGGSRPVPLNSVYFLAVGRDDDAALILAAYLNSLPIRVFARTAAERAKNGFFRFFAWTLAVLPVPADWRTADTAALLEVARTCRARGGIEDAEQQLIDGIVARNYRLSTRNVEELRRFDAWLAGGAD